MFGPTSLCAINTAKGKQLLLLLLLILLLLQFKAKLIINRILKLTLLSKKDLLYFLFYYNYNYLIIFIIIIIIIIIIISNIPYCLNFNPFQYGRGGGTLPWAAGILEPLAYITTVSQTILY